MSPARGQHLFEAVQQLGTGNSFTLIEFLLPVSRAMRAAGDVDNPLTRAAFEMQQQIADAVRAFVRAPPHVGISQGFHAPLNLRQVVGAQESARLGDKVFRDVSHVDQPPVFRR